MATEIEKVEDAPKRLTRAKSTLTYVALFLGELRDGLTMVRLRQN